MNLEQNVLEKLKALPPDKQQEALDFIEFLERKTRTVVESQKIDSSCNPTNAEAWSAFFRIGDSLADTDTGKGPTLTSTLLSMRR